MTLSEIWDFFIRISPALFALLSMLCAWAWWSLKKSFVTHEECACTCQKHDNSDDIVELSKRLVALEKTMEGQREILKLVNEAVIRIETYLRESK